MRVYNFSRNFLWGSALTRDCKLEQRTAMCGFCGVFLCVVSMSLPAECRVVFCAVFWSTSLGGHADLCHYRSNESKMFLVIMFECYRVEATNNYEQSSTPQNVYVSRSIGALKLRTSKNRRTMIERRNNIISKLTVANQSSVQHIIATKHSPKHGVCAQRSRSFDCGCSATNDLKPHAFKFSITCHAMLCDVWHD